MINPPHVIDWVRPRVESELGGAVVPAGLYTDLRIGVSAFVQTLAAEEVNLYAARRVNATHVAYLSVKLAPQVGDCFRWQGTLYAFVAFRDMGGLGRMYRLVMGAT